jgi:hypothetical protein
MKKLEEIYHLSQFIREYIIPYYPFIVSQIKITDIRPKPIIENESKRITGLKLLQVPIYGAVVKKKILFYKPITH